MKAAPPKAEPRNPARSRDHRAVALRTLLMDRSSRRVIESLTAAGVPSILLKGPTTAQWLYQPGERDYLDLDILVRVADAPAIDRTLAGLGHENPRAAAAPDELDDHSWTYQPLRGATADPRVAGEVDVHYTFAGILAAPDVVWRELRKHVVAFPLAGGTVDALDEIGRAFLIVLHAARDGRRKAQSYQDLTRMVKALADEDWRHVTALARKLDALEAFAAGLLLTEDGPRRMAALGVEPPAQLNTYLYRRDVPVTAHRVEQLFNAPGVSAKAKLAARELWPTTAWLLWWAQERGFGSHRLLALRARRVANVLAGTPPAVAAWLRVRRTARSHTG